ncbi:MAG: FmdB family zinc ribbon protein [Anaerolineae bacterium]
MPIYEFLCRDCNRVFSFLARSADTAKQPTCPRCGGVQMEKQVSRFAFVRGAGKSTEGAGAAGAESDPLDDPRVEREMMRLMRDAENLDENDPRQLGQFMRRMTELTGEPMDAEMEEAVRRLEAGEDPEKIEEDMGDVLGGEGGPGDPYDPYDPYGAPTYDEGLYPL